MKNTRIILLFALLLATGCAWADDRLLAKDMTVAREGTAVLAIETDFEKDDYIGYQFDLTLPKGLYLTLNATGKVAAASLTDLDIDGKVYSTTETATTYRLLASKMGNPRIPSGSYVLLTVTVESDGTLRVNDVCECTINNIKFSDSQQQKTEMADVSFGITISNKVVLDENSLTVPTASDGDVDILVRRSIKAGQWSTICLPFDMTEEQVYAAFGNDVELAELDTDEGYVVNDDGTIEVFFIDSDLSEGLYGNWPYIIRTSTDINEFETTAQIVPAEDDAVAEYVTGKGKNKKTKATFTGTLHAQTVIPEYSLFLSNSKFFYSVGLTRSKAFRAYLWLDDVLPDVDTADSRIAVQFSSDAPTGIREVFSSRANDMFDLQGRRLNRSRLQKGIYIRNSHQVIVK